MVGIGQGHLQVLFHLVLHLFLLFGFQFVKPVFYTLGFREFGHSGFCLTVWRYALSSDELKLIKQICRHRQQSSDLVIHKLDLFALFSQFGFFFLQITSVLYSFPAGVLTQIHFRNAVVLTLLLEKIFLGLESPSLLQF